jgi:hypothetical protein
MIPRLESPMVARVWRGYTTVENADTYEPMLKPELLPGLSGTKGFRGSILFRRRLGDAVEFVTMILFGSIDDIRAIAGENYETAVIPDERKRSCRAGTRRPSTTRWLRAMKGAGQVSPGEI